MEEYVHRCGRTGRAERTGEVLTFVTWEDRRKIKTLIEILERGEAVSKQIELFLNY